MTEFFSSLGLSPLQWGLIMVAAALIGANKTGLVSISLITIPIFASVFGGKASTGIILPILILADLFAVFSFRKNIRWKELIGLFPWAGAGIIIALLVGNSIPDNLFRLFIALSVFAVLIFLVFREFTGREIKVKSSLAANAVIGLLGGFATMIGNAAGPIMSTYFISLDLEKNEFVSTRAWFFWLINLFKLPLHIFVWNTVDLHSFVFDLMLLPAIVLGALGGIIMVRRIPEKPYRIFIIAATFVSAIFLII